MGQNGLGMRHSWGSMLRTARAPVAVLLLGGLGLTVPPQTSDMLAFLDADHRLAAFSFLFALLVFGGYAWFWSRAALAARFGIEDHRRSGPAHTHLDWTAFNWLPRLLLLSAFLIGVVIALKSPTWWTVAGAVVLGALAVALVWVRPRPEVTERSPAPRDGFRIWIRGGAKVRLLALLRSAPFGARLAGILLILGLLPLALGLIEAFTATLHIPNLLAVVFPGPGVAVFLLRLMIGPLTAATFVFDDLTLQWLVGHLRLSLRRPPVLSAFVLYVFVIVPAWLPIHVVRVIRAAPLASKPLDVIFAQWTEACAPGDVPVRPVMGACKIVESDQAAIAVSLWSSFAGRKPG